jgi:homoserine kinase
LEILIAAARSAGALGACLSGAGPSVLALTQPDRTDAVARAYGAAAASMGLAGEVRQLGVAPAGAEIIDESGRVARPADQLDAS